MCIHCPSKFPKAQPFAPVAARDIRVQDTYGHMPIDYADQPQADEFLVRSIWEGQLLWSESFEDVNEAYASLNAKTNEYLNAPVSMSGTSIQIIRGEDVVNEQYID